MSNILRVEYMCSKCGTRCTKGATEGKPDPGHCPRNGGSGRHTWVTNRHFYKAGFEPKRDYARVEFMCRHCGAKVVKGATEGKPEPGRCPRRTNDQPHMWLANRKY